MMKSSSYYTLEQLAPPLSVTFALYSISEQLKSPAMRQCLKVSLSCLSSSGLDICNSPLMVLQKIFTLTNSILPMPPLTASVGDFIVTKRCLCASVFFLAFLTVYTLI